MKTSKNSNNIQTHSTIRSSSVISVVLGSYNRFPYLKLVIASIREELNTLPHEIFVVDGGSSDGSLKWLINQKDIITIVHHNHGYWKGDKIERRSWGYFMNLAFKSCSGKYICMLSDDSLVIPGAILNGYKLFEDELKAKNKIGGVAFYYRNWPIENSYYVNVNPGKVININHGLYLKSALEEINYINEKQFLFYCADDDICLSLTQNGYKIIDSKNSFIEHLYHPSIRKNIKIEHNDYRFFIKKWESKYQFDEKAKHTKIFQKYTDYNKTANKFKRPLYFSKIKHYAHIFRYIYKFIYSLKKIFKLVKKYFYKFPGRSFVYSFRKFYYYQYYAKIVKIAGYDKNFTNIKEKSNVSLDVLIPVIEKDLDILRHVIKGVQENLMHPINDILIISPMSNIIKRICANYDCKWVCEDEVLPLVRSEINIQANGLDRSGWLFQQFIKLSVDKISDQNYFLVMDSDTVLIRPQIFIDNDKEIFNWSLEYWKPYFTTFQKLTGEKQKAPFSFVTHHMLLERNKLNSFKRLIENKSGKPFYNAIIDNIDLSKSSFFSEYESYGNYVYNNFRRSIKFYFWFNKSIQRNKIDEINNLKLLYKNSYKSLSFHSYST